MSTLGAKSQSAQSFEEIAKQSQNFVKTIDLTVKEHLQGISNFKEKLNITTFRTFLKSDDPELKHCAEQALNYEKKLSDVFTVLKHHFEEYHKKAKQFSQNNHPTSEQEKTPKDSSTMESSSSPNHLSAFRQAYQQSVFVFDDEIKLLDEYQSNLKKIESLLENNSTSTLNQLLRKLSNNSEQWEDDFQLPNSSSSGSLTLSRHNSPKSLSSGEWGSLDGFEFSDEGSQKSMEEKVTPISTSNLVKKK